MAAFERVRGWGDLSRLETAKLLGTDPFTVARYDAGAPVPDEHAETLGEHVGVSADFIQCGDEIIRELIRWERGI